MSDHAPAGRPSASLHFAVGEMNGKLDQLMATLLPQLASLDTRVTTLESFRWQVVGVGGFLTLVITLYPLWQGVSYVFHLPH